MNKIEGPIAVTSSFDDLVVATKYVNSLRQRGAETLWTALPETLAPDDFELHRADDNTFEAIRWLLERKTTEWPLEDGPAILGKRRPGLLQRAAGLVIVKSLLDRPPAPESMESLALAVAAGKRVIFTNGYPSFVGDTWQALGASTLAHDTFEALSIGRDVGPKVDQIVGILSSPEAKND